jgi:hypothetical protein
MPAEATGCLLRVTGAVRVVAEGVDLPFRRGHHRRRRLLRRGRDPRRVRVRAVGPDGASARVTVCVAGECQDNPCEPGQLDCDGACADPATDPNHCGGCGIECETGLCEGGACDPSTSIDACGGCDGSCSFGAEVCVAGECQDNPCEPGQLDCDGACADPATDPNHCGGCGIECETGLCEGGACACPEGLTDCYDGDPVETLCVNTDIEAGHCGSCFTNGCSACDGGDCILLTDCFDSVACGDGCAQLDSDPDHCGGCHNACDANEACVGGDCTCTEGFARCGGDACIELATSDVHCGRCDHPCGVGQRCEDSVCVY